MRIGKNDKATSQEVKACLKSLAVVEDMNLEIFWIVVSESCVDTNMADFMMKDFKGGKNAQGARFSFAE
jgi:hypothetical protein